MKRVFSLKPCPFCGGNSVTAEIYFPLQEFRIYCGFGAQKEMEAKDA